MKAILTCAFACVVTSAVTAQADSCHTATPMFPLTCGDWPFPYPDTATQCRTFSTPMEEAFFFVFYSAGCGTEVTYTLLASCEDTLAMNTTGSFNVIPGFPYTVCITVACTTPGLGIRELCPVEQLTLPVDLLAFSIHELESGLLLTWTTMEQGTLFFLIGGAEIPSHGPGVYTWTDNDPESGWNLYVLEGVDFDGVRRTLAAKAYLFRGSDKSSLGIYNILGQSAKP